MPASPLPFSLDPAFPDFLEPSWIHCGTTLSSLLFRRLGVLRSRPLGSLPPQRHRSLLSRLPGSLLCRPLVGLLSRGPSLLLLPSPKFQSACPGFRPLPQVSSVLRLSAGSRVMFPGPCSASALPPGWPPEVYGFTPGQSPGCSPEVSCLAPGLSLGRPR